MCSASSKTSPSILSPLSGQTVRDLLRIKVLQWSQDTGLPACVHVRIYDKIFNLHKQPLCLMSGYFSRALESSMDLQLPGSFPGGAEIFEMVALFGYAGSIPINPFNVTALRCAAEFLEMTEHHFPGNLMEMCDLYLNQVVLQNWEDTLIVLQKCQAMRPCVDDLLIVRRCVESLAFMVCMQILDPEQKSEWPVSFLLALKGHGWDCRKVKEIALRDCWVKDFIALPLQFFKRIIESLRRQGMKEKYISPIIIFYANKWVLSDKTHQFDEDLGKEAESHMAAILQGIIELLPVGDKMSRAIPVGFYFALLSRCLKLGLLGESVAMLEEKIIPLLHLGHVDDFLFPDNCIDSLDCCGELAVMVKIVSKSLSFKGDTHQTDWKTSSIIVELWDIYLSKVATHPKMELKKFVELIDIIPQAERCSHDNLYQAMSAFLMGRPKVSQEEKALLCKHLNCQKLSLETCIEAVQNELMPLRLMVEALFVQQLNTREMVRYCTDSFQIEEYDDHCSDFSTVQYRHLSFSSSRSKIPKTYDDCYSDSTVGQDGNLSLSCSRGQIPRKHLIGDDLWAEEEGAELTSGSLKLLLQAESKMQRNDYESTSGQIQNLEEELLSLKKSIQSQSNSKNSDKMEVHSLRMFARSTMRSKNKPIAELISCVGSVNRASQKCASRLLKVFQWLSMSNKGNSKRRQIFTGSSVSSPCRKIQHVHKIA